MSSPYYFYSTRMINLLFISPPPSSIKTLAVLQTHWERVKKYSPQNYLWTENKVSPLTNPCMISAWVNQHKHDITLEEKKLNVPVLVSQAFSFFLNTSKYVHHMKHSLVIAFHSSSSYRKNERTNILRGKFRHHFLGAV